LSGDRGRLGRLWDLEGRRGGQSIGGLSRARDPLSFSPDGRFPASTGSDADIRFWVLAELLENRNQP
jgi:hypothetical protein